MLVDVQGSETFGRKYIFIRSFITSLLITGISRFLQNRDEITPVFDDEFKELVSFSETAHFDFFLRGSFPYYTSRVDLDQICILELSSVDEALLTGRQVD